MEENSIKVYVQLDSNNVIINMLSDLESQITGISIEGWIQIDEGVGDKYAHAQGNYFPKDKGLIDSNGKYNYKLTDGKVTERTSEEKINLDEVKQNKINELNQKCNEIITNGFYSNADGTNKLYDFELENQINLLSLKQQAVNGNVISYYAKCESCHSYTSEQFLQLAMDAENFKFNTIEKYKLLKTYVESLNSINEINSITWDTEISSGIY
jgi:hypothetical protein